MHFVDMVMYYLILFFVLAGAVRAIVSIMFGRRF
jgi:hypothetical protein